MKTKSTKLCDLSDSELTTGSRVSEMLKSAGYTESASTVINTNSWWDMTVDELERELAGQKPNYSEYTTTVHSAPENYGTECTDEQAEKVVENLRRMISEQFPGIHIRINPCYGGCGSMADATHNGDGDTDDTCKEIDAWISENWEKALDI